MNNFLRTDNYFINLAKYYNVTDKDKVKCFNEFLWWDHVNLDENKHVGKLIKNNAKILQIPGVPLEAANVIRNLYII